MIRAYQAILDYLNRSVAAKILLILASFGALLAFGVIGLGRSSGGQFGFDFAVLHGAGQLLLSGGNPYLDYSRIVGSYAYPPQMGLFTMFYGFFDLHTALNIHTTLNLLSILTIVWVCNRWFLKVTSIRQLSWAQTFAIGVIIANPFMMHSVFQGQVSLLAFAFLLLSHHARLIDKPVLSGILLGLSTIKPQISLLYIIWLLCEWRMRTLIIGGIVSLLIAAPQLAILGPITGIQTWFSGIDYYMTLDANKLGFQHVVGFDSFFHAINMPHISVKFLLVPMFALILWKRRYIDPRFVLILLLVLSLSFMYGHDSDFIALAPLWSWLIFLSWQRQSQVILTIGALALYACPQGLIRKFGIAGLNHWRTFLIPIAAFLLWYQIRAAMQERQQRDLDKGPARTLAQTKASKREHNIQRLPS